MTTIITIQQKATCEDEDEPAAQEDTENVNEEEEDVIPFADQLENANNIASRSGSSCDDAIIIDEVTNIVGGDIVVTGGAGAAVVVKGSSTIGSSASSMTTITTAAAHSATAVVAAATIDTTVPPRTTIKKRKFENDSDTQAADRDDHDCCDDPSSSSTNRTRNSKSCRHEKSTINEVDNSNSAASLVPMPRMTNMTTDLNNNSSRATSTSCGDDDIRSDRLSRADHVNNNDDDDDEWEVQPYIAHSKLVHVGLRGNVPDHVLLAYGNCHPVVLKSEDRIGKYRNHLTRDQYVGLACRYCNGTSPGFGRYFPNSYQSLLNGTNTTSLVQHFITECRSCPANLRTLMTALHNNGSTITSATTTNNNDAASQPSQNIPAAAPTTHITNKTNADLHTTTEIATTTSNPATTNSSGSRGISRPRYGSRKRFYTHIWNTLRSIDPQQLQQPNETSIVVTTPFLDVTTETDGSNSSKSSHIVTTNEHGKFGSSAGGNIIMTKEQEQLFCSTILASDVVQVQDRFLVSDTTLLTMAQMKICTLTTDDQVGRCKDHVIGFIGLCCVYCTGKAGKPGYGRYFPSSVRSLAQADSCQQMMKHLINKCTICPLPIKELLRMIHNHESNALHQQPQPPITAPTNENLLNEIPQHSDDHVIDTTTNLSELVPTTAAKLTPSMMNGELTDNNNPSTTVIQQRIIPTNMNSTTTSSSKYGSRQIFFRRIWARLHHDTTISSPVEIAVVDDSAMQMMNLSNNSISQNTTTNIAFDDTNHETTINVDTSDMSNSDHKQLSNATNCTVVTTDEVNTVDVTGMTSSRISWHRIVGVNNPIVNIDTDRGLIPDVQFAAMAQMDICLLTEADQIGWFKNRDIGYIGLCCKHCRGRPSFGRYFPNSVRSLAQTTCTQTIISHVALYCPQCPQYIRDAVLQLQRGETSTDDCFATGANPSNYGSRKVFFDRVWTIMNNTRNNN